MAVRTGRVMTVLRRTRELASRNASFHEGGFTGALLAPLKLVFALTLAFIGFLVVAWIVDWTFVFKVWPEGIDQLKSILAADLTLARDLAEWHIQRGAPRHFVILAPIDPRPHVPSLRVYPGGRLRAGELWRGHRSGLRLCGSE